MLSASQGLLSPRSWLEVLSRGSRERAFKILQHVDRALVLCPAHYRQGLLSVAILVFAHQPCCLSIENPILHPR